MKIELEIFQIVELGQFSCKLNLEFFHKVGLKIFQIAGLRIFMQVET